VVKKIMGKKVSHLEMIQNVIARLSHNSFLIKGWTITLISAFIVIEKSNLNTSLLYIAVFPTLLFWIIDSYFLYQERLFRKLFNKVRLLDEKKIDFSMDTKKFKEITWIKTFFSKTLFIFYGLILLGLTILILYGGNNCG
jgi:hypothetical protein